MPQGTRDDAPRPLALVDRYEQADEEVFLTGVHALIRVLLDQRRADADAGWSTAGFVSGYPGSPLAGLDLELVRRAELLDRHGIVHRPGVNEELAATAIAGSQLASLQPDRRYEGVVALWYGKAPGLDRAGDAMRHGNLMGTNRRGGVLVCVGDDPQAKSSSVPSTSEPTLFGLGLPVLSPSDPQDVLDLGRHGVAMSRASGLWVGLRVPASVADASQTVVAGPGRVMPVAPDFVVDGVEFEHRVTAQLLGATLLELERSLYGPRMEIARRYAAANGLNRVTEPGDDDVLGIVAAGPAYLSVLHALRSLGITAGDLAGAGVRLCKVAVPYPLDATLVRSFAAGLREVLVVEDKRAFLELQVKDALYGMPDAPAVVGKRDEQGRELVPTTGEVDADALARVVAARLLRLREVHAVRAWVDRPAAPAPVPLALVRGAYFCSGCPHNTGVKLPAGASVGAGSGCHGLAIQMAPRQVGKVVGRFQMGGEGAMWIGMSPFVDAEHFFQNLGDGTLAHSGSLAVRAAVASGVNVTIKLLFNSSVAMTGGQQVTGGRGLGDVCRSLLAEGVGRIIVTTDEPRAARFADLPADVEVRDRHGIIEAQEELAAIHGVTVLVHDQACALDKRRARRAGTRPDPAARVYVNPLVCEGCGDCGVKSNCLSVHRVMTPYGERARIHQESCNVDLTCLDGDCPALVTVAPGRIAHRSDPVGSERLPDPPATVLGPDFTVRITGIGGTGVVTIAQVLAVAAHLEGRSVRGADQTGIAQKGGSVVSDLRIGLASTASAHRLGDGECDLYLGCDLVVAAEPKNLLAASPTRTVAVMSIAQVPTGRQVADWSIPFPPLADVRDRVDARTRVTESLWLDAAEISRRRLGADVHANVVLLGAAFQRGSIPLRATSVEQALAFNEVDGEANVRAFRLGRLAVVDPTSAELAAGAGGGAPGEREDVTSLLASVHATPGGELETLLRRRIADLIDYQNLAYARRYSQRVGAAIEAESARCSLHDGPLARAVAVQLHRLMAVKDEYEVARLLLDEAARGDVEEQFGAGARVTYHLRPPLLEALGLHRKLRVSRAAPSVLRALRGMRRLRGRWLDPFGHTSDRRRDAALLEDYERRVDDLIAELDDEGHTRAVELAELPDLVRGFGAVRDESVLRYRERLSALGSTAR